jgi:hypothetical protein
MLGLRVRGRVGQTSPEDETCVYVGISPHRMSIKIVCLELDKAKTQQANQQDTVINYGG